MILMMERLLRNCVAIPLAVGKFLFFFYLRWFFKLFFTIMKKQVKVGFWGREYPT